MKKREKNKLRKIYVLIMAILAIISIMLIIQDYFGIINILKLPWFLIDIFILCVFTIDYIFRFIKASNKKKFFKENFFDLIAIIPLSNVFYIFRITRVVSLFRLLKIFRLSIYFGKFNKYLKKILDTNGLAWILIFSTGFLIISAMLFSVFEKIDFGDSLWWAVVTITTVGYGDIVPHTLFGRMDAVILMIVGIGLIGSLASSLTSYFVNSKSDNERDIVLSYIKKIENENNRLKKDIEEVNKKKQKINDGK